MSVVPQLPLALRYPQDERLETFIGAPDGALAQLRAIAVGAAHDWVYLEGAAGTGKTHLGIAIARALIRGGTRGRFFNVVDLVNRLETETRG
ncbi:MAG: ATP-binding protein, partial [Stenotrophomonas sp.]